MMRTTDTILGKPRGSVAEALAFGARFKFPNADPHFKEYVMEVFRLAPIAGIDPSIVIAQSADETSNWSDAIWATRINPAGIGVTDGKDFGYRWADGAAAARGQLAHLYYYVRGYPHSDWEHDDPRSDALRDSGLAGSVKTIDDLSGKWASNPNYGRDIADRGNAIFPNLPDQEQPMPETFTTAIPGLPGGPLVTTYRILTNLIPASSHLQRPGIKPKLPRVSVQHGTGNPNNPDAWAEAQYFVNGAEGRQASVHLCTDDTKAVVVLPLDEVSWQAADGSGPGNMQGVSCEMMEATAIWSNPTRRDALIALTADLMGRIAARLDIEKPQQHFDFNWVQCCDAPCDKLCGDRHDCPNKLRHIQINGAPAWETYTGLWYAARADERRRMDGEPEPPIWPHDPLPAPDELRAQGHLLTVLTTKRLVCTHGGRFKTAPSRDAPDIAKPPYKAGKHYTFSFSTTVDGEKWLVSTKGSWVPAKNFEVA